MKNASQHAGKLAKILKASAADGSKWPGAPEEISTPIDHLVFAYLLTDATSKQAATAYAKLMEAYVDYNDLRVSDPRLTVDILGDRYPRVETRVAHLRATLQALFEREHAVDLRFDELGKREARKYLDSLHGIEQFAASYVMLVSQGGRAMPVDEMLREALIDAGAIDAEATVEQAESFLCQQIKASDQADAFASLRAWAEAAKPASRTTKKSTKKAAKKTTKKAAAKKTTKKAAKKVTKKAAKKTAKKTTKKAAKK